MGGSSAKNLPPPQYVGFWSGRNGTVMIIDRDGRINYSSSGPNGSMIISRNGYFDAQGLLIGKSYSPKLQGFYRNQSGRQPVFIVNGEVLKKMNIGTVGALSTFWSGNNASMGAGIMDIQVGGM